MERLKKAVEDPEALWSAEAPREAREELIARNLIAHNIYHRTPASR